MSSAPEGSVALRRPPAARVLRRVLSSQPYTFPAEAIDDVLAGCPVVQVWPGTYAVTGQDACRAVLRDPRFAVEDGGTLLSRRPAGSGRPAVRSFARELLSLNGAEHLRLRAVLARAFVPPGDARMRSAVRSGVADVVRPAGARLRAGQGVELEEVCTGVPALAIGRLLGIPDAAAAPMASWSDQFSAALRDDFEDEGVLARADAAVLSMQARLRPYLAPGVAPAGSVVALLLEERGGLGEVLGTEEALLANVILVWSAGLDTTRSLVRSVLSTLAGCPGLVLELRDDPGARTRFLRETERLHPPITVTTRVVAEAAVVAGQPLAEGSRVLLMLDAANRDVPGDPHTYQLHGPGRRSVSFGGGPRTCLGLPMARLAGETVLAEVLACWPEVRHEDGHVVPTTDGTASPQPTP